MKSRIVFASFVALSIVAVPAVAGSREQAVQVKGEGAFRESRTLVIGGFKVGFLTEKKDKKRAGGGILGLYGAGGNSSAKSQLSGVSPEVMQAITDAAYEDFKQRLSERGYTVLPASSLYATSEFAKVKPLTVPQEIGILVEKDGARARFFAPQELGNLVIYYGEILRSGFNSFSGGASEYYAKQAASAYARSSGNAVISVVYLVNFENNDERGGRFSGSSRITARAGLSIVPAGSKLTIYAPSGKEGSIVLHEPVMVPADFATIADSTSKASKTVETIGNVTGILMGFGTNKSRSYTFTADQQKYRDAVVAAAQQANERVVGQIAAYQ